MQTLNQIFLKFLWLFWHICYSSELELINTKPIIRTNPVDTYSTDGVLEFSCQADGSPKPLITWYDARTRQPVVDRVPTSGSTSGIHVNQHYGRLMISNPIRDTIYSFYCNASNSLGWTVSDPPVQGGVAYLDSEFRKVSRDLSVYEKDPVELFCIPPRGVPAPDILWLHNNQTFAAMDGFKSISDIHVPSRPSVKVLADGRLQFRSIAIEDRGEYVCVAINVVGQRRSPTSHLYVKPRIQFMEKPKPVHVRQGEDAKFNCRTEGNHMVQWSKQHGTIATSRAELGEDYLLLKQVQLSDAGVYVCTAPGATLAKAKLIVDSPPTFTLTPDDLTVQEGSLAIFNCATSGYPKPSIYWELSDSTPLFPSEKDGISRAKQRFTIFKDGRLEITNVRMQDAGRYQCTAHSSIDRIHSSAFLYVLPRPVLSQGPSVSEPMVDSRRAVDQFPMAPIIGLPPANQSRIVGEVVTLDCELNMRATNHQLESSKWLIVWYRATSMTNGILRQLDFQGAVADHRYTILPGGSLQIYNVQLTDSGLYLCSAQALVNVPSSNQEPTRNYLLQTNWTAHLNILPPGSSLDEVKGHDNPLSPPRNLRVTNKTESTLTLEWDSSIWHDPMSPSDLDQSPQTFWVEFFRPDRWTDGWKTVERNWRATTVKINGLHANTAYYFLIRPRYQFARVGWASAPLGPVFTLPRSEDLRKVNYLSTNKWLDAIRNLQINSINLYVLSPEQVRATWSVHTLPEILSYLNGYTLSYRPVPLLQCVSNYLDISGFKQNQLNAMSEGYCSLKSDETRPSNLIYARLQRLHTIRTKHHTTDEFHLDIPTAFDSEQLIHNEPQRIVYESSGLLKQLRPFHCYTISVKAYVVDPLLGKVESQESTLQSVLMFETFPTKSPQNISAEWSNKNELKLSWEPPSAEYWNGLLMGYIIYVYDEMTKHHHTHNVSYAIHTTIITGLIPHHMYHLQMAAATCKGVGLRSSRLTLKPELNKPGLGAGWGFDYLTGLHVNNSISSDLINKPTPLFITIVISFVLLLLVFLVFFIWCLCSRRHSAPYKHQPTVLITNTSLNGDTGSFCNSKTEYPSNGDAKRDRNSVHLEPLLHPTNGKVKNKIDATAISNISPSLSHQITMPDTTKMNEHPSYGLYSVAEDAFDRQESIVKHVTETNLNYTLGEIEQQGIWFESGQTMPSQLLGNRMVLTRADPRSNQAYTGIAKSIEHTLCNYTPPYGHQSSNYITYQPIRASPSQHDFPHYPFANNSLLLTTTSTGLPPIAPVAQLNGSQQDPSLFDENGRNALTSVTPYATASIVHLRSQPVQISTQPQLYPDQTHIQTNWPVHSYQSNQSSYSSNESGQSSDRCDQTFVTTNPMFSRGDATMPSCKVEKTNPQTIAANSDYTSDTASHHRPAIRDTTSNQSKSDSTASTNTRCSDEKSRRFVNINSQPQSRTSERSPNQDEVSGCDSVYSLVSDDHIPPPPASPPPPTPGSCRDQVEKPNSVKKTNSGRRKLSPSGLNWQTLDNVTNSIDVISIDDRLVDTSQKRNKNATHHPQANGIVNRPRLNGRKYPNRISTTRDEQQNPTYAQVY